METKLHHYCFDIRNDEEGLKWSALCDKLEKTHKPRKHHAHSGGFQPITRENNTETVQLERKHLFNNQWNEAGEKGRRLFDWYQEYRLQGKYIKQGHWLEITKNMKVVRDNTEKCGYCGAYEPAQKGYVFCPHCIGSEYLDEKNLFLTRMRPVSFCGDRKKLTDAEKAHLIPIYNEAQGLGRAKRANQKQTFLRKKVANLVTKAKEEAKEKINQAKIETKAYTFLLDAGWRNIDNVIYYIHTKEFSFGWRTPLTSDEKETLTKLLKDFPFKYTFKG